MGFIALACIVVLILFTFIIPSAFNFLIEVVVILALAGALLLLWKLLAQVEQLRLELANISKTISESSSVKQPVCRSCGKMLSTGVNFCSECGTDQRQVT